METAIAVIIFTYDPVLTLVIVGAAYRARFKRCGCPACRLNLDGEVRVPIRTDEDRDRFVKWLNCDSGRPPLRRLPAARRGAICM